MSARTDTGIAERGLRRIRESFPGVGQRAGKNTGETSASKMIAKVHVQTGELKNSIGVKINQPYHTKVGADADHAYIEASKGGDHDFFFGELVYLEEGGWANAFVEELKRSI